MATSGQAVPGPAGRRSDAVSVNRGSPVVIPPLQLTPLSATLLATLDDAGEGWIALTDARGRFTSVSTGMADALGVAPAALLEQPFAAVVGEAVASEREAAARECLARNAPLRLMGMIRGIWTTTTYRVLPDAPPPHAVIVVARMQCVAAMHDAGADAPGADRAAACGDCGEPGLTVRLAAAHDLGALSILTPRELEVLRYLSEGLTTPEIAKILHRSPRTIQWHRMSLGVKLRVSSRVDLARIAIRAGLNHAPLHVLSDKLAPDDLDHPARPRTGGLTAAPASRASATDPARPAFPNA